MEIRAENHKNNNIFIVKWVTEIKWESRRKRRKTREYRTTKVSMFFSLIHSGIIMILTLLLVLSNNSLRNKKLPLHHISPFSVHLLEYFFQILSTNRKLIKGKIPFYNGLYHNSSCISRIHWLQLYFIIFKKGGKNRRISISLYFFKWKYQISDRSSIIEEFLCSMYGMKKLYDINQARFEMFLSKYKPKQQRISTLKKVGWKFLTCLLQSFIGKSIKSNLHIKYMDVFCKTTPTNSITIKLRLEDYDRKAIPVTVVLRRNLSEEIEYRDRPRRSRLRKRR